MVAAARCGLSPGAATTSAGVRPLISNTPPHTTTAPITMQAATNPGPNGDCCSPLSLI
ncbi:hypothetical protein [Kribbella sp. HUAS MG21]|uniref:Uncharacterized protein n=1 Tax=Kribbella sp. HUAS MG21 TaxID=3160966 RepID=A0AAU7TJV3_9ACTN